MSRKSKTMQFRLKSGNKPSPTKFYGAAAAAGMAIGRRRMRMNPNVEVTNQGPMGQATEMFDPSKFSEAEKAQQEALKAQMRTQNFANKYRGLMAGRGADLLKRVKRGQQMPIGRPNPYVGGTGIGAYARRGGLPGMMAARRPSRRISFRPMRGGGRGMGFGNFFGRMA